ncbi:PREDICTED: probable peptide chain release factor C12orf65 homolog, mitochondrial [Rhagoletis zephyria]|uniref:probable peptide chain release factor C12orf65 homolog, mitochondrial n=1 Tax=Rhagoletis zephyria TaxID=28612 RepID=UPI0008118E40|nr:PREDICTED: probable peptide chain release factor C12orf65 homolog, mitochondrial [Rhagoletis zephyria]KAH9393813.1 hypothetical protein TYRP_021344 [Tyrophagus putrescentiae]
MYFKLLRLSLSAATTRYTNFTSSFCTTHQLFKFVPDKSKVPPLVEDDIEEQFVTGSGPGGQNVNRLQNCAHLRHIPTGIVVKCHQDRTLQRNRQLARQMLLDRLDQHLNGEDSVSEQKKRYILTRKANRDQKAADRRSLKKHYQETLKLKHSASEHNSEDEESETLKS